VLPYSGAPGRHCALKPGQPSSPVAGGLCPAGAQDCWPVESRECAKPADADPVVTAAPRRPQNLPLAPNPPATEQPRSVAMPSASDCRRRRRGPQVRQERARPMDQSREAHRSAWPLHSPRGGMTSGNGALGRRGGTRVAGVGSSVGFRVGSSVGSRALGPGGTGPRPAGLRSLPAKQHAPKARPLPTTDCGRHAGSRAGRQGRMAAPCRAARWRGAGHSPLTAGHRAPAAPRAFRRAWWPASRGEGPPPDPPPPRAARGQRVTVGW